MDWKSNKFIPVIVSYYFKLTAKCLIKTLFWHDRIHLIYESFSGNVDRASKTFKCFFKHVVVSKHNFLSNWINRGSLTRYTIYRLFACSCVHLVVGVYFTPCFRGMLLCNFLTGWLMFSSTGPKCHRQRHIQANSTLALTAAAIVTANLWRRTMEVCTTVIISLCPALWKPWYSS